MNDTSLSFCTAAEDRLYRDLLAWVARHDATLTHDGPTRTEAHLDRVWQSASLRGAVVDPDGFPVLTRRAVWYRLRGHRDAGSSWPVARGVRFDALVCLPDAPVGMSFHFGHHEVHPSRPWPSLSLRFIDLELPQNTATFGDAYTYRLDNKPVGRLFAPNLPVGGDPLAVRPEHGYREELLAFSRGPKALFYERMGALSARVNPLFAPGQTVAGAGIPPARRAATQAELDAARVEFEVERAAACRLVHDYEPVMKWLFETQLPAEILTRPQGLMAAMAHDLRRALRPTPPRPSFARARPLRPFVPQRARPEGPPCPRCGCMDSRLIESSVLHGNLATPASDSEVEHGYRCGDEACGHRWSVFV